jgi:hypothetical protein
VQPAVVVVRAEVRDRLLELTRTVGHVELQPRS